MGILNAANLKKTWHYLKRNGLKNTWYAAKERVEAGKSDAYQFIPVVESELETQRLWAREQTITFSILVPAYRTKETYLRKLIASVQAQSYPHWELILADATEDESVKAVLDSYEDERIRYVKLEKNAGISENTNQGLKFATGDYVGLLDHDDLLTKDALYEVARVITDGKNAGIDVKMIYSDEDKCNGEGTRYYDPNRKEKFNLDLLFSNNYICHFLVMESVFMKELGFRKAYDGAQDYDLVLRAAGRLMEQEEQIVHLPKVLYHWRCHEDSTAQNPESKQYAYEAGLRALQNLADEKEWNAEAVHLTHRGFYRLQYAKVPEVIREDLAAVGGRILKKGKTIGGRMSEAGEVIYAGLPAMYSGYLHRAVLTQDAEVLDIRCIRIAEECQEVFRGITGVMYKEISVNGNRIFDISVLPEGADYKKISIELSMALRKNGKRLLYLPELSVEEK